MYDKRLKGWYIVNNISPGKKFFLEQLGFEVIEIRDFNNLYQCFTEIQTRYYYVLFDNKFVSSFLPSPQTVSNGAVCLRKIH